MDVKTQSEFLYLLTDHLSVLDLSLNTTHGTRTIAYNNGNSTDV